jgi:hypothetical protein
MSIMSIIITVDIISIIISIICIHLSFAHIE